MNILQFEDNTEKYMAIRSALGHIGTFDITWAQSVEEGMRYLDDSNANFDVILTDMQFPIHETGRPDWSAGEMVIREVQRRMLQIPVITISSAWMRIEEAYACIWYMESRNWEEELKQALQKIAKETYQYL